MNDKKAKFLRKFCRELTLDYKFWKDRVNEMTPKEKEIFFNDAKISLSIKRRTKKRMTFIGDTNG